MKKQAALAFVILLGLGSAAWAGKREEKLLFKADKVKRTILEKGPKASASLYSKAREAYQKLIDETDERAFEAVAEVSIGEVYGLEGKKTEARRVFENVLETYPDRADPCARALFGLGRIHEINGDWERALENYNQAMQRYDMSPMSLEIPLYLARHPRVQDSKDETAYYERALAYYATVQSKYPESVLALQAMKYQYRVFVDLQQWREAIQILTMVQKLYPGTEEARKAGEQIKKIVEEYKRQNENQN